ncbi:hypothetical protein RND71_043558 [Anisodus tanguticus]|uniref:Cleavage and polyadenylation specificity factor subunit 3 n=1 Tax=Anisodus tanguticus TaxID=243964 RepID=A0AAE1UTL9_9SOLA|nr:hypothetical protein RND71_043558 [Anisodus tanguticus]
MDDKISIDSENDELNITPLGAGQEVGRSCIMMEFKGKKIMLDCGLHPGLSGIDALPFVDMIETDDIDLLLISHFHLDHCGALPWFLTKTTFKGRCFMTHATKAIYRCLLADCIKVSNVSADQMLYTEADLEASMDKIETINFHEEKEVNGIKFWCYNAGHVLGASMFMIEIAGVKTLYTGDFSRQEDRHLMSAEIPSIRPEVLIIESTYGTHIHEKREEREARFTGIVHDTVTRGGRCLIPVFALGRAQELLLILDEYWSLHPELHEIPIYYASLLAKKCMAVYQTYINAMNDRIKKQIAINNPFVFKHISNLKSIDHFEDYGPCVIMATPGMMQSGLSRELFELWCPDARNTCIIAGYCVEGTLAKQILAEPEEIVTLSGSKIPRKCQIEYISFSAHTDYYQTSEFVRTLRPPHIILVHGESNEMGRLKAAINREYEDDLHAPVLHNPKNTQTVKLHFRGHETCGRVVKVGKKVTNVKPGDVVAIEPAHLCFKLPDNMSPEEGACIEPLSVGIHSCNRADVKSGNTVLICGAGPIGLFTLVVAKAYGASKVCITGQTSELNAKELIAFVDNKGFEKVIECSGAEISIQSGLMATAAGGTYALVANCAPMVNVPLICGPTREVDIKGVFRYANR